jgi:hypothetical protein
MFNVRPAKWQYQIFRGSSVHFIRCTAQKPLALAATPILDVPDYQCLEEQVLRRILARIVTRTFSVCLAITTHSLSSISSRFFHQPHYLRPCRQLRPTLLLSQLCRPTAMHTPVSSSAFSRCTCRYNSLSQRFCPAALRPSLPPALLRCRLSHVRFSKSYASSTLTINLHICIQQCLVELSDF